MTESYRYMILDLSKTRMGFIMRLSVDNSKSVTVNTPQEGAIFKAKDTEELCIQEIVKKTRV